MSVPIHPSPNFLTNPTAFADESTLLRVDNIAVNYGAIKAIHNISFDVPKGKIVSLIGSNGAGKTTTLRAISGLVPLAGGKIFHKGERLDSIACHQIVRRKIAHSPEGRGIFLNLTVEENLDLGAWTLKDKKKYAQGLDRAFTLFPRLKERRNQDSGTLSGGEQQMLAIARALMSEPELILLDEPSLGLAPQIIERIFEIIQQINRDGVSVLLVEQNALQALQIAHEAVLLESGQVVQRGPAKDLLSSEEVRKAYLGIS